MLSVGVGSARGSPANSRGNFTKLAFARRYILRQFSTLIVYLYLSSSRSFMFFWRPKERKAPSPAKSVITAFCSGVAGRHPSVGCYLPQTAVRSSIGDKTTRLSRNNSIAYMHRSNKFCPVSSACPAVRCDFDGAGLKILPLYAL